MKTKDQAPLSYQVPAPDWYRCDRCERQRRLFRPYNWVRDDKIPLLCRKHTVSASKKVDPKFKDRHYRYAVGGWVLAVPCENGAAFWGYTSIPEEGLKWWERLP